MAPVTAVMSECLFGTRVIAGRLRSRRAVCARERSDPPTGVVAAIAVGTACGGDDGDAAVFDAPHTLDLRRDPIPQVAFGFGPHFCLGASLARLELRCMMSEVLTRLPDLELTADDLPTRPSNFITGFEAMPVRFTPTPPS